MVVWNTRVRAQAPFAGMVLIGFCVDVSSFLGELRAERDDRQQHAKEILDWAMLGLGLVGHEMGTIFVKRIQHCRKQFRLMLRLIPYIKQRDSFRLIPHSLMPRSIYIFFAL